MTAADLAKWDIARLNRALVPATTGWSRKRRCSAATARPTAMASASTTISSASGT